MNKQPIKRMNMITVCLLLAGVLLTPILAAGFFISGKAAALIFGSYCLAGFILLILAQIRDETEFTMGVLRK